MFAVLRGTDATDATVVARGFCLSLCVNSIGWLKACMPNVRVESEMVFVELSTCWPMAPKHVRALTWY